MQQQVSKKGGRPSNRHSKVRGDEQSGNGTTKKFRIFRSTRRCPAPGCDAKITRKMGRCKSCGAILLR